MSLSLQNCPRPEADRSALGRSVYPLDAAAHFSPLPDSVSRRLSCNCCNLFSNSSHHFPKIFAIPGRVIKSRHLFQNNYTGRTPVQSIFTKPGSQFANPALNPLAGYPPGIIFDKTGRKNYELYPASSIIDLFGKLQI